MFFNLNLSLSLGNCFVRRLNGDRAASPKHLDRTLMFYPKGAPCHSSLFESSDLHDIEKRPPEVELERCEVRCKNQGKHFCRRMSDSDPFKEGQHVRCLKEFFIYTVKV